MNACEWIQNLDQLCTWSLKCYQAELHFPRAIHSQTRTRKDMNYISHYYILSNLRCWRKLFIYDYVMPRVLLELELHVLINCFCMVTQISGYCDDTCLIGYFGMHYKDSKCKIDIRDVLLWYFVLAIYIPIEAYKKGNGKILHYGLHFVWPCCQTLIFGCKISIPSRLIVNKWW